MNNITNKLTALALTLTCICSMATTASAASITSATSVGVYYNYVNDEVTRTDDFVTNVTNSNSAYSSISTCTNAALLTTPQAAQLREALKANVVFLNSHGNPGLIRFKYYNGGSLVNFDVKTSTTSTSHVSLADITLSNVNLIQFFGCHTAEEDSSGNTLISVARSQGADLAVGFNGEITTRTTVGRAWLNEYHSKLVSGNNWISSFAAACAAKPNTSMQTCMRYLGNSSLTIAPISSAQKLSTNVVNLDISDSVYKNISINSEDWSEDTAFRVASQLKLGIDSNDYNCTFTLLNEEDNTGIFVFDYDVGENITSNKAYAVIIMEGKVTDVISNNVNVQINKEVIAQKYKTLSTTAAQVASKISLENIVNVEEQYTYDCSTDKLTYTYVVYTEEDGVVVDNVFELEV